MLGDISVVDLYVILKVFLISTLEEGESKCDDVEEEEGEENTNNKMKE